MPVTAIESDPENLTMSVVADFPVPLTRLWDAYSDPRQLESFWGPPTYPATFVRHDFAPGGRSEYVMTGPEGDAHRGYWEWVSVDPLQSFEVRDGFSNADGANNDGMPSMHMLFTFASTDAGSRVTTVTTFNSLEEMEQLVKMGMEEGTREAMGQMDAVLADLATFASSQPTAAQVLNDTQVRVSRVIRGSQEQVWQAFHEPELLQRWLLGPDGWSMPVCEVALGVGDHFKYEWRNDETGDGFGMTGELLESIAPTREVFTEQMVGEPYPPTMNELTLTPLDDGTLVTYIITYASTEARDATLASGMVGGMETSFERMEESVIGR